jgi:hypothetical protein
MLLNPNHKYPCGSSKPRADWKIPLDTNFKCVLKRLSACTNEIARNKHSRVGQFCYQGRVVPTVYFLGAQKCGSTSMTDMIFGRSLESEKLMPLVLMNGMKESKFFVNKTLTNRGCGECLFNIEWLGKW